MSTQVPPAAGGVASRQSRNPRRSEYDRHQAQAQVHGSGSRSGRGEREREQTGEGVAADEVRAGAGAGAGARSTGSGNRSRSITAPGDGDARDSLRKEKEKTATELVKEAKTQIKLLDQLLKVKEPWDREVDVVRNRIRSAYKTIHFSHPTSSPAQSIDHLWIYTTHVIIARYRSLVASLDRQLQLQQQQLQQQQQQDPNSRRRTESHNGERTGPVEIRKVITRFKGFLSSEQGFYRTVISDLVRTFGLCRLGPRSTSSAGRDSGMARGGGGDTSEWVGGHGAGGEGQQMNRTEGVEIDVRAYLEVVGIVIPVDEVEANPNGARHPEMIPKTITLSHDEALKKVGLVHKALVCLGDLERYKEQYGVERDRQFGQSGRQGQGQGQAQGQGRGRGKVGGKGAVADAAELQADEVGESYVKAKSYYEVARGLLPDNGNPSNQMAVIATYARDMFTSVYHYYRALACQQPFLTARQNLDKMLRKCLAEWRASRGDGVQEGSDQERGFPELDPANPLGSLRSEEVILQAILITGDPTPAFENLVADHAAHLGRLLADRAVPAEVIVKTIVMAITCHWDIRLREVPESDANQDEDHEGAALWYLFNIAGVMLDVADQEVKDGLGPERLAGLDNETVVVDEVMPGDEDERSLTALYPYITAVLRRLLPALRIFSKWLKANASLLSGNSIAQQEEFWTTYASFCRHLEALFPLSQLPELSDALEEDFDMRGFSPLKRGMMEPRKAIESNDQGARDANIGHNVSDVHPNEEQLMRISDLLCDGKLIASYAPESFRHMVQPQSFASRVGMINPTAHNTFLEDRRSTLSLATSQPFGAGLMPPDALLREESEFGDAVSVSTATEDDPVNLAMRATLADGSSLADDDERLSLAEDDGDDNEADEDDDEEEIIWPNRQNRFSKDEPAGLTTPTMAVHSTFHPTNHSVQGNSQPTSTRAHDLLHSLMTGSPVVRPSSQTSSPAPSNPAASPFSNTASPLLFGGVGFSSGGSIWTRGLNEPDGEVERSRSGSGFARAGSVTTAHGLQGWSSGPLEGNMGPSLIPGGRPTAFPPPNGQGNRPYSPFG